MTMLEDSTRPATRVSAPRAQRGAERQKIVIGDCLCVLERMEAKSIDVVVTSPPYNIGVKYNDYADDRPHDEYLKWIAEVGKALRRVLKDDGSFFLNLGGSNRDPWSPMDVAQRLRGQFELQNHIIWVKSISIGDDTVGHFKPITSDRFLNNNFEHVFHFTKTGRSLLDRLGIGVPFKDKSNISRWGHARDRRCRGNTWFIPYKTVRSKTQKFDHPATFPVELAEMCIGVHGSPGGRVLDPFLGTGTTLVAARRMGLEAVGIEIDPVYAGTARERLEAEA